MIELSPQVEEIKKLFPKGWDLYHEKNPAQIRIALHDHLKALGVTVTLSPFNFEANVHTAQENRGDTMIEAFKVFKEKLIAQEVFNRIMSSAFQGSEDSARSARADSLKDVIIAVQQTIETLEEASE